MKSELIYVTPKQAREWLATNTKNRRLRVGGVETLAAAYERGEWRVTHQGIAFSRDGVLLDGQHRLTMVSQLEENAMVPMLVTTGLSEEIFSVIDQHLKRTISDVTGVSQDLAAVGRFMASLYDTDRAGLTVPYVRPFVKLAEQPFSELISFCSAKSKAWSASPVRAAAVVRMLQGEDADHVKVAYRSLVMSDFDHMVPSVQAIYRQQLSGLAAGARTRDLFCRAMKVFDSRNARHQRIVIKDYAGAVAAVRDDLTAMLGKDAPTKRAGAKATKATAIVGVR